MITQVANPSSVPSAVSDYEAQNAHISAFNNIVNNQPFILTNSGGTGLPAIKVGTYIQYGGNLYVVDTEDYAITGTPVNGNNYIRLSGSTTLTAEWVQDISSYVWNEVYGYKESGSYFLLPYLVVKDGTEYTKYSMALDASFGKLKATTLDTGQGANELYAMNQNVRTTDSPTFAGLTLSGMINTGQGSTKIYKQTFQTLSVVANSSTGDRTVALDPMEIGEMRICTCSVRGENRKATITAPAGGAYLRNNGGYLTGGSTIISGEDDSTPYETKTSYLLLWRIS
jgi:hypothetical protein